MAKRPTITVVASGYTSQATIDANFVAVRDQFDNTLSLDGSTPNAMGADFDLNSHDILNGGTVNADQVIVDGVNITDQVTNTANSASAAAASAAAAATSETNAASSATSAASSASSASTSETNAAASATAAAASEADAETASTVASAASAATVTNAAAAATSATNAATSETNAATSAAAAAASEANVIAIQDAIDDTYLGAKATEPTVDNDGDPLNAGDWYFNTTENATKVYDGSSFNAVAPDLVGDTTPELGGDLDAQGYNITNITNLGIGLSNPTDPIHVATAGLYRFGNTSTTTNTADLQLLSGATGAGYVSFGDNFSGTVGRIVYDHFSNFMALHTGAAERMRIDSSGNVAIGASSVNPNYKLRVNRTSDVNFAVGLQGGELSLEAINDAATASVPMRLYASEFNLLSGNVGIGTSSPDEKLEVYQGNIKLGTDANTTSKLIFERAAANRAEVYVGSSYQLQFDLGGTERMRIDSSGNVGIGVSSPSSYAANANNLVIGGEANAGVTIASSSTTGNGGIYFADGLSGSEPNRGIVAYSHTNDAMQFFTAASERMRIDSSGNVSIGTTSTGESLRVKTRLDNYYPGIKLENYNNTDGLYIQSIDGQNVGIGTGRYYNSGSWRSDYTDPTSIRFDEGMIRFYAQTGVTADANYSPSERMRIDSSGNVGIGTETPSSPLHVKGSISGATGSGTLIVEQGASPRINMISAAAQPNTIAFGDPDDNDAGRIVYSHSSDFMSFWTAATERMRIDTFGNLLVGKSATNPSAVGGQIQSTGIGLFTVDSNHTMALNRLTNDGTLVYFQQNSSVEGSISISGSTTSYNTTSDVRKKENIEDAKPSGDLVDSVQVRQFDWKSDGRHQRYGFIAQELEDHFPEAVHTDETPEKMKSVDYSKLVPLLVKEIQDLRKRVADLEEK